MSAQASLIRALPRSLASKQSMFRNTLLSSPVMARRWASTVSPSERAANIVDSVPAMSPLKKTSLITAGVAATAWAVSKELYVFNDDSVMLAAFLGIVYLTVSKGGPLFSQYAESYKSKVASILNEAREEHKMAIKRRIEEVEKIKPVAEITKDLFAISKQLVEDEAEIVRLSADLKWRQEVKSYLTDLARIEENKRAAEAKEMSSAVISSVVTELTSNKSLQQQILDRSIEQAIKVLK